MLPALSKIDLKSGLFCRNSGLYQAFRVAKAGAAIQMIEGYDRLKGVD